MINIEDGAIIVEGTGESMIINDTEITIGEGDEVTISAENGNITGLTGLDTSVEGLPEGVTVGVTGDDVTINGAEFAIAEEETNYTVTIGETFTIEGISDGATVNNAPSGTEIIFEGEGVITFGEETYTLTGGGGSLTFEDGILSEIKNFVGEFSFFGNHPLTINGSWLEIYRNYSDNPVTISAGDGGIYSIYGLEGGDIVNGDIDGTAIFMPDANGFTVTLSINYNEYYLNFDNDGVIITPFLDSDIIARIEGLAPNSYLGVGEAGNYEVITANGSVTTVTRAANEIILMNAYGEVVTPHEPTFNIDGNSTIEEIINKIAEVPYKDENSIYYLDEDNATYDFRQSSGSKRVSLVGGNQDIIFNNDGDNIAVVPDNASGEKFIELGNGNDNVVVGNTEAKVTVYAGQGQDDIVSKSDIVVEANDDGTTKITPLNDATIFLEGYEDIDYDAGTGIQTSLEDIASAIENNLITFDDGTVSIKGMGAVIFTSDTEPESATKVNFYNKNDGYSGSYHYYADPTKVGFTHNSGGVVDMSGEEYNVIIKGNYTKGSKNSDYEGTLLGGNGDDTIFAGAGDYIDAGSSYNLIKLTATKNRNNYTGGATISSGGGHDTIEGFNFGIDYYSDNIIFNNGIDYIAIDGGDVILNGYLVINDAQGEVFKLDEYYMKVDDNNIIYDGVANFYWATGEDATVSVSEDLDCDFINIDLNEGNSDNGYFEGDIKGIDASKFIGNSNLVGNDSDNVIKASESGSTITGGGNDTLYGGEGADVFTFDNGSGEDVIIGIDEYDTVQITGAKYTTTKSGKDLIIGTKYDSIKVKGGANVDFSIDGTLDGSDSKSITGTSGADTITNTIAGATINALGGDDYVYSTGDSVTIDAGAGNDYISNHGDNVTVDAGAGNDTVANSYGVGVDIKGDTGNDYLYNYGGSGVTIDAGAGNDTVYNSGDNVSISGGAGNDHIYNTYNSSMQSYYGNYATINAGAGDDFVSLGSNSKNNLVQYASGDGNDTISGLTSDDTLKIVGAEYSTITSGDDLIISVEKNSITVTGGANVAFYIDGTLKNDFATLTGTAKADNLTNANNDILIDARGGADTISNSGSNVTVIGGKGNDYISNSGNGNLYQYAEGDGKDTITGFTSNDTLQITKGTIKDSVLSGGDLILTFDKGSITLNDMQVGSTVNILDENGKTSSFTILPILTGTAKADTLTNDYAEYEIYGLAGNDYISNSGYFVTINGGKGNDIISNTGNGNLYKYASGDGNDTIFGFSESDTLEITKGSIKSSVISGGDLILNIGSGSITLKDMTPDSVINILNADGTESSLVVPRILQGTAKADTLTNDYAEYEIYGLAGNDSITNSGDSVTINGGKGNDLISNSGENILYQYSSGDGKDTISGFNSNDTLEITKGTIKSSVVSDNDLILTVGSGSITLKDVVGTAINLRDEKGNDTTFFVPYVHTLTKKADSFINEDDDYLVDGLGGNDEIDNFAEYVTIDGGDGNDILYNAGSNSSISGGKGNDEIDNFADNSTINGGKGNDTIYSENQNVLIEYATGDGKDLVVGFGDYDTLQITEGKIKNTTVKGMDVIVNVGSGSITLEDAAGKNINIMDSDGTLTSTVLSGSWEGTAKADTYSNDSDKLTLYARGGNDYIQNYGSEVKIDGGTGHDYIYSNGDNATIIGGKGNDSITNNSGAALYQYAKGDGRDIISGFSKNDTLQITSGTVTSVTTSNGDTFVKVGTGSITLKDYSSSVNLVDSKNAAISYNTLDLFEDNNFISDENSLDSITEEKYSVTQIQDTKTNELSQLVLTYSDEK